MNGFAYIVYVLMAFIIIGGLGYVSIVFNSLIQVKNNIGKAWHNIEVLLLQRNDEILKLADVAKEYGKYETDLMGSLVRLRQEFSIVKMIDQKTEIENQLAAKLKQLSGARESNPDIKANTLYQGVQKRISDLEGIIADRRAFFNETVTIYNIQIEHAPQVFIARLLGFQRHRLLED